jgi:hypothetical protein
MQELDDLKSQLAAKEHKKHKSTAQVWTEEDQTKI